jgi:hypothetical protein
VPDPFYLDQLRRITQNAPGMSLADRQRLASMGRFAQQEGVDIGMYGDRDAEGYGAMLEDLTARIPKPEPAPAPVAQPRRQATPFATPVQQETPMFPQQNLQQMANSAMSAWGNELDSRVAQNREMRRMEHEKELERIRQEAALKKIAAEQQMMMMQMKMQDAARRGDNSKTLVNGKFVPSWMA